MREFLWFLAGANVFILKTTHSDQGKFTWVGATLLLTALTACFTGGFALYTVFKDILAAIFAGALWGLFILSIDSMIVATLGQSQDDNKPENGLSGWELFWYNTRKNFPIILRLLISFVIGLVIAKPLEFKIFEKEIKDERVRIRINECKYEQNQANQQKIAQYQSDTSQINVKNQKIDSLNAKIPCYRRAKAREIAGIGGTFPCNGETYETSGRGGSGRDSTSNYFGWERGIRDANRVIQSLNSDIKTLKERSATTIKYLSSTDSTCSVNTIRKEIEATTPTILEAYVALDLLSSAEVAAKRDTSSTSLQSDSSKAVNPNSRSILKTPNVQLENAVLKAKSANTAIWFVTFLIVLIELSPVLLKSMQNPKEYKKRLKEYMTDVQGDSNADPKIDPLSYVELINKYPFLDPDNSLANAYKKRKNLYEKLVPELKTINELHAEANSHFNILTNQTTTNEQTAKDVNDAVAASMKEKQIRVADKLLGIWEQKLNQKIDDDPDQFMGDSEGKKQNSQQPEDASEQYESDSGQAEEPAAYEPAGKNKAEASGDKQKDSVANADGQQPAGSSANSSSEGTASQEESGKAGTESAKEAEPEPSEPGRSGSADPNSEQGSAPDAGGTEPSQGTAQKVNEEVAAPMQIRRIRAGNRIREQKLNQKIDDPDQFMGDSQEKKQKSQETEDPFEERDSDESQEGEPAAYDQADGDKAKSSDDHKQDSATDADDQELVGESKSSSSDEDESEESEEESSKENDSETSDQDHSDKSESNNNKQQDSSQNVNDDAEQQGLTGKSDNDSSSDEMPNESGHDTDPKKE